MKRLLLLMKSESYRAKDFLDAAARLGVELVVGSDQPHVLADFAPARTLHLDFGALEASFEAVAEASRRQSLDGVVAVEDEGTVLAAYVATRLGLAANPVESAVAARNKRVFREVTAAAGLPSPWFREFPLQADPAAVAAQVPYPCVLKPLSLSAGRGVIRADGPAQFVAAFRRVAAILADPDVRASRGAEAEALLVESFLPGAEVALEGMIVEREFHLLAFFDKPDPMDGPHFEETMFVTPSRHPRQVRQAAVELAGAAAQALGLRTGPVHAELRLHDGRAFLLEVAARSIGGHCSRVLDFGMGLSLEELILRQALGLAEGVAERERRAAGVMMIPIPAAGTLRGVEGQEEARRVEGIEGVEISIPIGQPVAPPPEGHRYLGFIFAKGDTPAAVESALRQSHAGLRFTISAAPE